MNEVEKLYENAGINEKRCFANDCLDMSRCHDCYFNKVYQPQFTAEKQLELLKICFEKYERLEKVRGLNERCIIYYRFDKNGYTEFVNCETWEETIAGLINNLWQDLTEAEHKQIKEILE